MHFQSLIPLGARVSYTSNIVSVREATHTKIGLCKDTGVGVSLLELPSGFLVVSHIQHIACQPKKTTIHGDQSRCWWSAELGKK